MSGRVTEQQLKTAITQEGQASNSLSLFLIDRQNLSSLALHFIYTFLLLGSVKYFSQNGLQGLA